MCVLHKINCTCRGTPAHETIFTHIFFVKLVFNSEVSYNDRQRFALAKGREFIACLPGAAAKLETKILN